PTPLASDIKGRQRPSMSNAEKAHRLYALATSLSPRGAGSERAIPQARHVGRPRARGGPMEAAIFLGDGDVVDRGFTARHQAVLVELPLFVAVGAVPLAARVVPFVLEAHRDAVVVKGPEVLDQAVVELLLPFAREKGDNRLAALKYFRAIAP